MNRDFHGGRVVLVVFFQLGRCKGSRDRVHPWREQHKGHSNVVRAALHGSADLRPGFGAQESCHILNLVAITARSRSVDQLTGSPGESQIGNLFNVPPGPRMQRNPLANIVGMAMLDFQIDAQVGFPQGNILGAQRSLACKLSSRWRRSDVREIAGHHPEVVQSAEIDGARDEIVQASVQVLIQGSPVSLEGRIGGQYATALKAALVFVDRRLAGQVQVRARRPQNLLDLRGAVAPKGGVGNVRVGQLPVG